MINPAIEAAARATASELGFEYDLMLASKSEWIDKRGVDGTGQFRDVNDPFRCDIADVARAAVIAFLRAYVPSADVIADVLPNVGNPDDTDRTIGGLAIAKLGTPDHDMPRAQMMAAEMSRDLRRSFRAIADELEASHDA